MSVWQKSGKGDNKGGKGNANANKGGGGGGNKSGGGGGGGKKGLFFLRNKTKLAFFNTETLNLSSQINLKALT